ncbi:hypothetical protein SEHO0A_03968 [Salmonella enterica subsp. houtenae str. ATCC BAA-1581]|nr:hypothetical protein SEHO0A_03968 [Salmonella enterica subsp. houtenae str. ATCC BAA-1581]
MVIPQTADEPHIFSWGSSFAATAGRDRDIFPLLPQDVSRLTFHYP